MPDNKKTNGCCSCLELGHQVVSESMHGAWLASTELNSLHSSQNKKLCNCDHALITTSNTTTTSSFLHSVINMVGMLIGNHTHTYIYKHNLYIHGLICHGNLYI